MLGVSNHGSAYVTLGKPLRDRNDTVNVRSVQLADFRLFFPTKTKLCTIHLVTRSVYVTVEGHLGEQCIVGEKPAQIERRDRRKDMTKNSTSGMTRRGVLTAFAATAVAAAPTYSNAAGFLRGGGDVRRLRMYSGRTGERMDTIYWIEGQYIGEALAEINSFMRDWRNNKAINIDIRNVDIMAASLRLMDANEPYMLLSGYRSPETNAMLRSRSSGVARNSLHIQGQAADLRLESRSTAQMARAARSCAAGGVGRYSGSNFVHMDCGPVRSWGG